jgi:phosphoglycolate phosphatase
MLIVFDLDGTLVDSLRDLADSSNELLASYGLEPLPDDAVAHMVGDGARALVRRALAARSCDAPFADAFARFGTIYDRRLLNHTRPYPGVIEMLERVAGKASLAILTNKPEAATARVLDGLDLARFFDHVICGDGMIARKPAPEGLQNLMDRAGATPATTILVGDSPVDLQTARNSGARICLARYGFGFDRVETPTLDGTELFIDRPEALLAVITAETAARTRGM